MWVSVAAAAAAAAMAVVCDDDDNVCHVDELLVFQLQADNSSLLLLLDHIQNRVMMILTHRHTT